MQYTHEVEQMCCVKKGCNHGPAPIPQEGAWTQSTKIEDISGLTHGVGWCAPQQGACKLTLNVKQGVIQEALVETIGCSGMTHSAAMASEILPGKTVLEALNTDLVCDAINTAMRELFLQIVYGRTQSAYSEGGLPIGATLMSEKVQNVLGPGDHGSTYGGNPVCSAGALSVIQRLDDAFLAEVQAKSAYVFSALTDAAGVESVSGLGLMIGIKTTRPAKEVVMACMDKGVLCLTAKDKVRLLPALNIPMDELKEAIAVIKEACAPKTEE